MQDFDYLYKLLIFFLFMCLFIIGYQRARGYWQSTAQAQNIKFSVAEYSPSPTPTPQPTPSPTPNPSLAPEVTPSPLPSILPTPTPIIIEEITSNSQNQLQTLSFEYLLTSEITNPGLNPLALTVELDDQLIFYAGNHQATSEWQTVTLNLAKFTTQENFNLQIKKNTSPLELASTQVEVKNIEVNTQLENQTSTQLTPANLLKLIPEPNADYFLEFELGGGDVYSVSSGWKIKADPYLGKILPKPFTTNTIGQFLLEKTDLNINQLQLTACSYLGECSVSNILEL
jgi:hypothetical protein